MDLNDNEMIGDWLTNIGYIWTLPSGRMTRVLVGAQATIIAVSARLGRSQRMCRVSVMLQLAKSPEMCQLARMHYFAGMRRHLA